MRLIANFLLWLAVALILYVAFSTAVIKTLRDGEPPAPQAHSSSLGAL